jgi:polysaccharide pyruvyl transferase WcaK-like protein
MPRRPIKKVLLLHYYGCDNRGDKWIVESVRNLLGERYQYATVAALGDVPRSQCDITPSWTLPSGSRDPRKLLRFFIALAAVWLLPRRLISTFAGRCEYQIFATSTLAVSKGGSFILTRTRLSGWIYLVQILTPLRLAQRLGVTSVIAGQTFGPFATKGQRCLAEWVIGQCDRVIVRDLPSRKYAPRAAVLPDIVFAAPTAILDRGTRTAVPPRYLALSLIGKTYLEGLVPGFLYEVLDAVSSFAQQNNLAVRLFTQVVGPTDDDDDRPVLRRFSALAAEYGLGSLEVDSEPSTVDLLQNAQLTISCRMHAGVASVVLGTPTVFISYLSSKTDGLSAAARNGIAIVDGSIATAELIREGMSRVFGSEVPDTRGVRELWQREVSSW